MVRLYRGFDPRLVEEEKEAAVSGCRAGAVTRPVKQAGEDGELA